MADRRRATSIKQVHDYICGGSLFFGDLGSEVVLELASPVVELVLHHQRRLVGHVQSDLVGESRRLREQVEVSGRKAQPHWLVHLQSHSVLVAGVPLVEHSVAGPDLSGDGELDALLVCLNFDGLRKPAKLTADPVELVGRHGADRAELSLRNSQVFRVEVHERQVELRDLLST